jgi:hypothetical protein
MAFPVVRRAAIVTAGPIEQIGSGRFQDFKYG